MMTNVKKDRQRRAQRASLSVLSVTVLAVLLLFALAIPSMAFISDEGYVLFPDLPFTPLELTLVDSEREYDITTAVVDVLSGVDDFAYDGVYGDYDDSANRLRVYASIYGYDPVLAIQYMPMYFSTQRGGDYAFNDWYSMLADYYITLPAQDTVDDYPLAEIFFTVTGFDHDGKYILDRVYTFPIYTNDTEHYIFDRLDFIPDDFNTALPLRVATSVVTLPDMLDSQIISVAEEPVLVTGNDSGLFNVVMTDDAESKYRQSLYLTGYIAGENSDGAVDGSEKMANFFSNVLNGFLNVDIFGNISIGDLLMTVVGIILVVLFLRFFAGG